LCGCLVALVFVLLLCSGGVFLGIRLGFAGLSRSSVTDPVVSYNVAVNPTLILNNEAGSVTIKSGSQGKIDIQATRYASFGGSINNVHTQVSPDTNANTLTVTTSRSGQDFFNTSGIDFVITVPRSTNLQISTNAGSLNVSDVSGTMSLNTHAGTIGVDGAALTGSSEFKTNAGSVNFNGSIATSGAYDFETNAGSIDVTLPATSTFHVNANTDAGSINTSFPATVNRSTVGASLNADIGTTPQATVTLKTNAGSITLNKGSKE
jgi:Putative adhesin